MVGAQQTTVTMRKRTVGGFYTYDNKTEEKNPGTVCSGKSDARGLMLCEATLTGPGNVTLIAHAEDASGNVARASSSIWVAGGEWWVGGENADRMDLLPEKKRYQPGETAKFQVRMPFRSATAWVAIEREGVIVTLVVPVTGALTAYVLAVTHEAGFAIPDNARERMEGALIAFVEGRIQCDFWSPTKDLDMRKIGAIEALSRTGKATPKLLDSITLQPNLWPTHAVIDWLSILQRVPTIPKRDEHLATAGQVLRARLSMQGTKLVFSTERKDYWWWLMVGGDVNAARLIATVADRPGWRDDLPRLVSGLVARQNKGAWHTTTANLWGGLALDRFAAKFESEKVAGITRAGIEEQGSTKSIEQLAWATQAQGGTLMLPWPKAGSGTAVPGALATGAPATGATGAASASSGIKVWHEGAGKPWLTIQSLAAIPLKARFAAGYRINKTVTHAEQKTKGAFTRGDVLRIKLEVDSTADMTWVVVAGPVPAGATILGAGRARDSAIAQQGERKTGEAWPAYEERSFEAFRAYYEYTPKGKSMVEYTVRLNQDGEFSLPPTRIEAMYAPEMFGVTPNARMKVLP